MNRVFTFVLTILVPGGVLVMSVFGLWTGGRLMVDAVRSNSWPRAEGRVVRSELASISEFAPGAELPTRYWPEVEYAYAVDGEEFQGDAIRLDGLRRGPGMGDGREEAEAVLAQYPVGEAVDVYYDPKRPRTATLIRGATASNLFVPVFCVVLALASGGWFVYLVVSPTPPGNDADWKDQPRACPRCDTVFRSVQDKGVCPQCKHVFWASQAAAAAADG